MTPETDEARQFFAAVFHGDLAAVRAAFVAGIPAEVLDGFDLIADSILLGQLPRAPPPSDQNHRLPELIEKLPGKLLML